MIKKQIDTIEPINNIFSSRWSGVAYDSERPVSQEQLSTIMEAGRWAPSCFGDQPWRFIICDKSANEKAWKNLYGCLV